VWAIVHVIEALSTVVEIARHLPFIR